MKKFKLLTIGIAICLNVMALVIAHVGEDIIRLTNTITVNVDL